MRRQSIHVGIVVYPGVQQTAVHGLTDMLVTANTIIGKSQKYKNVRFIVTHWGLGKGKREIEPQFCTSSEAASKQTVLVIPGSLQDGEMKEIQRPFLSWIQAQYKAGAIACSVCKGAFVLGECGILTGRRMTTHWALEEPFKAQFPDAQLQIDRIIIDDGDIITAGGVMAWVDLGLRLIHRFAGSDVMLAVAKFLLVDPSGREQKFYSTFSPNLDHGDELVVKIQQWLQSHFSDPLSLEQLAEIGATSVRTLIRRFHKALAMSPTTYIQHVRIGKAKELLERTTQPMNQIAWKVGYEDPGSFRKVFQNALGLSPAEYRHRFSIK